MNLLAFDTSTDTLSIAVQRGDAVWQHTGAGGAQASAALIPAIQRLLAEAGLGFDTLDAIVFGRGPGSFTGLRTACAVAQGLAFGARNGQGTPVLPVDTLLAVAEEARQQHGCTQVLAVLDARMNEVYSAHCTWQEATRQWSTDADFGLCAPEALTLADAALWTVAGNAQAAYGERLLPQARHVAALPLPPPCCAWPRPCWQPARPCPPARRCRATSATRWHKPLPSAKPCAPRPLQAPPHHERSAIICSHRSGKRAGGAL